jgi:hypothetical protein
MSRTMLFRTLLALCAAGVIFWAGIATGQNKFGTPNTILHVVLIQWKDGVDDGEKKRALDGVKGMAAVIPGIKNVWTRQIRIQPRGYHDAFVIEFEDMAAHERYTQSEAWKKWREHYLSIRQASISPQITN